MAFDLHICCIRLNRDVRICRRRPIAINSFTRVAATSSAGRLVSPPIYIAQGGCQQFDQRVPTTAGESHRGCIYIRTRSLSRLFCLFSRRCRSSRRTRCGLGSCNIAAVIRNRKIVRLRGSGGCQIGGATHGSITFLANSRHTAAKMADQNLMWIGARSWAGQSSCSRVGGWQALAWVPVSC